MAKDKKHKKEKKRKRDTDERSREEAEKLVRRFPAWWYVSVCKHYLGSTDVRHTGC